MLAAALQAEVAAYVEQFADHLDEDGRRLVVRNGYHQSARRADRSGGGRGQGAAGQRQVASIPIPVNGSGSRRRSYRRGRVSRRR